MKKIYIIGSGKLGSSLASALIKLNLSPVTIVTENATSINATKEKLKRAEIILFNDKFKPDKSSIFFLTVPDDKILSLANEISRAHENWTNSMIFHCSGTLNSGALNAFKKRGATISSLHPLQTFDDLFMSSSIFSGIFFSFEGDEDNFNFAQMLVRKLQSEIIKIDAKDKIAYHIAAVIAANFSGAIIDFSNKIFNQTNIKNADFNEMMYPLIEKSIKNILQKGSKRALTGPLSRGNTDIIHKHLEYLYNTNEDYVDLYKNISKYIINYIAELDEKTHNNITALLE